MISQPVGESGQRLIYIDVYVMSQKLCWVIYLEYFNIFRVFQVRFCC